MPENPLISVIVPAFNAARYLGETLESIFAQTYRPLEVIVIDDGSTDETAQVAQQFPVHYAYQAHTGIVAALNYGVSLAQGDLLSFLDADDLWVKDKLTRQMAHLARAPELGMVFGHIVQFTSPDSPTGYHEEHPEEGYSKGTMLIHRAAFLQAGLFDPALRMGEFVDWYMRAREAGIQEVMLPEVLMKRRMHSDNMTTRERENRTAYLKLLKQALDRRAHKARQTPTEQLP